MPFLHKIIRVESKEECLAAAFFKISTSKTFSFVHFHI